jgi:hypothetical protein
MLFAVVREIEAERRHCALFLTLDAARDCYDAARHVCDNGPGEEPEDDPAIVSDCWLYEVDASDPQTARKMVFDGRATLLANYEGDGSIGT